MNTRFTLAAVISVIGALAFGFVSFLGNMYLKEGDYMQSVLFASIWTVALLLVAIIASKFKKERFNFKQNAIKELFFVGIYIVLAFFSMLSFTHFFTVQNKKEQIGEVIKQDIDSVRNMFDKYESHVDNRVGEFDGFLDVLIAGRETNKKDYLRYFKDPGPDPQNQKNVKLKQFKDDLQPDAYDTMKVLALDWLKKSEQIVLDVKPFGLMDVIENFEKNTTKWYKEIQQYDSTFNTFKEEDQVGFTPFTYTLGFTNITNEITKVEKPTILALLLLVVAHLLILFVYILAMRDGRSKGLLSELFSNNDNEEEDMSIKL